MDNDDFSSDESSIDPSQLVQDMDPLIFGGCRLNDSEVGLSRKEGLETTLVNEGDKDTSSSKLVSSVAIFPDSGQRNKIIEKRINLGQSIFNWQDQRKGLAMKQNAAELHTIRHDNNGPLALGSKLIRRATMAKIVSVDDDSPNHSGQCVHVASDPSSAGPLVDCVAIYNRERGCYILKKVDWTSNLKRSRASNIDGKTPDAKNFVEKQNKKNEQKTRKNRLTTTTNSRHSITRRRKVGR